MYPIFFITKTLWDREDCSHLILMTELRFSDLIVFLKVTQLHSNAECILNSGLLKFSSLVLLLLCCLIWRYLNKNFDPTLEHGDIQKNFFFSVVSCLLTLILYTVSNTCMQGRVQLVNVCLRFHKLKIHMWSAPRKKQSFTRNPKQKHHYPSFLMVTTSF